MADQIIQLGTEAAAPAVRGAASWWQRMGANRQFRVGVRLAIFFVLMFLSHGLLRRGAFFVLRWLRQRGAHLGPASPYPVMVIDGFQFVGLLAACWVMSCIERRRMGEYGLPLRKVGVRQFSAGAVWGLGCMTVIMLAMIACRAVTFGSLAAQGMAALRSGAMWALALLATALFEEYQFRGYPLLTLAEGVSFWPAAIILSTLFAMGHADNPGESRLGLLSVFVFGLLFSYLVRLTGSLWLPVGFHLSWDWAESFLFGVPDSGIVSNGRLFAPTFHGPAWLTGGSAGPEGSLLCPLALLLMLLVVHKVYSRRPKVCTT